MPDNRNADSKIAVGAYGSNGHQICHHLLGCPFGELVACAGIEPPPECAPPPAIYASLRELLDDPRVELVSLCSPRRAGQAADAIACLQAGKHVYAEKPAAFSDEALTSILDAAKAVGREFHEMADTIFREPFYSLKNLVRSGELGEVVQVWAQKSYPASFDQRPQDEEVDGGLIRQCAIHAVRMVEHLTGVRVTTLEAIETGLGNPHEGNLRTAASLCLGLENGGVGAIVANYCNPRGFDRRGNDQVRIFGSHGIAEITDDGQRSRVIVGNEDRGPIVTGPPVEPYFVTYLRHLLGLTAMPMTLEEELHPLRVVNRAKLNAYLNRRS